jgi:hypothetical protein
MHYSGPDDLQYICFKDATIRHHVGLALVRAAARVEDLYSTDVWFPPTGG